MLRMLRIVELADPFDALRLLRATQCVGCGQKFLTFEEVMLR